MSDTRERTRREASDGLQRAIDQSRERGRLDRASVQREVDRLSRPVGQRASADRPREIRRERDRLDARADRIADRERVQSDVRRLCGDKDRAPRGLQGSEERLQRLERVAERDPMRHVKGFDPRRAVAAERVEIQLSPEGFVSRKDGGLDRATERELSDALRRNGRC